MDFKNLNIAQYFIEKQYLEHKNLESLQQQAQAQNISLTRHLLNNKIISDHVIAKLLSQYFNLTFLDLDNIEINSIPQTLLVENILRNYNLLPFMEENKIVHIATDDPSDYAAIKAVKFYFEQPIKLFIVESEKLITYIKLILQKTDHQQLTTYFSLENTTTTKHADDDTPVIQWINRIILQAIQSKSSDLHFEPYEDCYRIRYRKDGILYEVDSPPLILATRIASRIKVMANLDISEKRLPQDGRFSLHNMDCRVSICPTMFGEKIVIRLLNSTNKITTIDALEFNPLQKKIFLNAITRPQGMILVTGPTGSGKTLTLYTALNYLNTTEKNIFTVEDPVEIYMRGINQVQINSLIGRTFTEMLRTFLRQDPDIIMIGEIRDLETADIAMKASQTGHLVFSTVHTNNTSQTLTRLMNMGVNTFHLSSSINLIIAQRLVRRLCSFCKKIINKTYVANGCHHCTNGYNGRIAIFEMMPISNTLQSMILAQATSIELFNQAKIEGMKTLYEDALNKVNAGITSLDEINRVVMNELC